MKYLEVKSSLFYRCCEIFQLCNMFFQDCMCTYSSFKKCILYRYDKVLVQPMTMKLCSNGTSCTTQLKFMKIYYNFSALCAHRNVLKRRDTWTLKRHMECVLDSKKIFKCEKCDYCSSPKTNVKNISLQFINKKDYLCMSFLLLRVCRVL